MSSDLDRDAGHLLSMKKQKKKKTTSIRGPIPSSDLDKKTSHRSALKRRTKTTSKRKLETSTQRHRVGGRKRVVAPPSSKDLRRGLESLPQELYNEIYDMTFTAPPSIIRISDDAKMEFANLIQVDAASRAKYIQTLCTNTVFIGQRTTVGIWIGTLEWCDQLRDVRVFNRHGDCPKRGLSEWPCMRWNSARSTLRKRGSPKEYSYETRMMESLGDKRRELRYGREKEWMAMYFQDYSG